MKKFAALILALALVLTAAAAEEATIDVVDWEGLISNEGMDAYVENGQFYELTDIGLKMWIPSGLQPVESEYTPYLFTDEEGLCGVSVFVEEAPEGVDVTDPDQLLACVYELYTGDDTEQAIVNGIVCVTYSLGAEDMVQYCVTYGTEDNHLITFVVDGVNADNPEEALVLLLMTGSIMAI